MSTGYLDKTGLQYFWGKLKAYFQVKLVSGTNIKTVNNNSLLGSGNINITGNVTGVKGSAESSYRTGNVNLTAANVGAVARNAEMQTTNPFAPNSLRGPYISKIDNAFYAADKRWTVTSTGTGTISNLFDGSYETNYLVPSGTTNVITMDFTSDPSGYFPGYPYGYILVSVYYTAKPSSISCRAYCNYEPHGIGWFDISLTPMADNGNESTVYRGRQPRYNISKIEFTITGQTTGAYNGAYITQIEMHLDRPHSMRNPFLSKYGAETLYYDLTAPNFIGNASNAKKVGDVSGTNALYAELNNEINIGGTNNSSTIFFAYRAKDSKPIPSKFVFGGGNGTSELQCKRVNLASGTSSYIDGTNYTGKAATAGNADTVNSHTVASDVPANAKFTDTVTTATTSGSGNAVTAISASNGALTITKGTTFLTSHQDISGKADKSATVSTVAWDSTNKKLTKTINGSTTDVVTAATLRTGLNVADGAEVNQNAFSTVSVGGNTIQADSKTDTLTITGGNGIVVTGTNSTDTVTIELGDEQDVEEYIKGLQMWGNANGVATLGSDGKVPSSQLPASGEVNQNAFSNIKVGSTTIQADSKTDTLELVAGSNVTLTPDATNDKVTIASKDTVTTATTSGSGNAVTAISASNGALTVTKGTTFLTSHQDISGKADKSATVSTVAWDSTNKKLTKTINGTTTDVVTAATLRTGLNVADGAEVNQNAFSNVSAGGTTLQADSKTDTLTINGSTGIIVTGTASSDTVTISLGDDQAIEEYIKDLNMWGSANGIATLDSDGKVPTSQLPSSSVAVSGVKGNAESSYRTGNVNLTPANIGALGLDGGTLTGGLTLSSHSSAIGYSNTGTGSKSISTGTTSQVLSGDISISAGTWMLVGQVEFPANTTGVRHIEWRNGSTVINATQITQTATTGGIATRMQSTVVINATSAQTMHLYCYQNSGASRTVTYNWQLVRIA